MTPPSHDSGLFHEVVHGLSKIVEPFMRPINVVSKALSDRLEHWLSRKPKLYVTIHPQPLFLCLAWQGEEAGMQLMFIADFTHPDRTLLLTGGYFKGMKPWHGFVEPIEIPPQEMITPTYTLGVFVHPVVGRLEKRGRAGSSSLTSSTGRTETDKIEFKFVGSKENPLKVANANTATGSPSQPQA